LNKVFWLRKGMLAGRSGPNQDEWRVEDFREQDFSAILSVNDGEMVHETLTKNAGIEYTDIPMSSNAPVRPGDKEFCLRNLPRAMRFIGDNVRAGSVLVHCRSGKDRTGMVLAAALIAIEGLSANDAMDEVLKVRPIAFSAEGWGEFGIEVLSEFESQNRLMLSDATKREE